MEERKKVTEFQLLDHGIDHAQYFQGCGVSFTSFDTCYTGCGDNPAEAFDDALEQLAMDGFDATDLETRILAEENDAKPMPDKPGAHDECIDEIPEEEHSCCSDQGTGKSKDCSSCLAMEKREREHEGCELYYYMSIKIKE
jgi:hypothetical protein